MGKDISVPLEGDLKASSSISDLRLVKSSRFAVASLSVLHQAYPANTKRAKKPAATGKSPCSWKKLASDGDKIKLTVPLDSSSSAERASSSQSMSPLVYLPK